ncbi:MAG: nucleoside hydrolase [Chloroflexi bacterium]|nr:nucleoside hydrolase [Chloroflexota bacterium]
MYLPIIIDTDMAFDDWMAILYLLCCPFADVRAITIAADGEAHADFGVQNALRLLALTGNRSTSVAAGRKHPLYGTHSFPLFVRLAMDFRLGLGLPRPDRKASRQMAVELLIQQLQSAPQPVTVIALGPLTNLAEMLLAEPTLSKQISMIYFMGGALHVPGNLAELNRRLRNPFAEWNVYIDPYAVSVVLHSGVPLTFVPLDVTNQHPLTNDFYQRCAANRSTPAANFVYQILQRLYPLRRLGTMHFWDPLTAVIATHPEIAQFQARQLTVIQAEGNESGRMMENSQGETAQVCTKVDYGAFEQIFLETLNTPANASSQDTPG